jgi:hypothetical protein
VNDAIRQASRAAHSALDVHRRERQQADRQVRALRAIDRVLESLEEINLSGRGFEPVSGVSLLAMQRAMDCELPPAVASALTPVDMHEALLDWQEQLLDRARPMRAEFREVDAEIDPPETRRRRRRRRAPAETRPIRTAA